ncbi:hypothetical protein M9H77_35368 [Catharanthus roseus]|uniref:Uncharacterized protein n=1 Tax=Catharanthus roseus TaxID=4058 RepID=A0ACB9ZPJ3_CATRO|nr:hypothetical protein M9H77_35368 [Catharanthus roseus]
MCLEALEDCNGRPDKCPRIYSLVLCEWRVRWLGNRALARCLAGIDYEMPKLVSHDLVMGSGLCSWSSTVALHVLLNLGIEAVLMYLDLFKLPSCVRTPHVGSNINAIKATKEKYFLITLHELFS